MQIRYFTPKLLVIEGPPDVKIDMEDTVLSVENKGDCWMGVRLRKFGQYGQEYTIALRIPPRAFQQTVFTIMRREGMALGEIGDIDIKL